MSELLTGVGKDCFTSQFFVHVPLLERFEMEMETIEEKQVQLDPIIAQFKDYRIGLNLGKRELVPLEFSQTKKWVGPAFYEGTPVVGRRNHVWTGHQRLQMHNYVVQSVIWHAQIVEETGNVRELDL